MSFFKRSNSLSVKLPSTGFPLVSVTSDKPAYTAQPQTGVWKRTLEAIPFFALKINVEFINVFSDSLPLYTQEKKCGEFIGTINFGMLYAGFAYMY